MKLEEATAYLEQVVKVNNGVIEEAKKNGDAAEITEDLNIQNIAVQTVLQALKNSIPKKKVEDVINKKSYCTYSASHKVVDVEDLQELLEDK